ncbi:ATP-binding cassette domain-containing protein [Pseudomonas aeruginosa]|nr:ATP-binding cassette domain-containing protein [Pseudomonas aeruginosa]
METVVPVEACGLVKRFATRGGTPLVALDEVSLRIPAGRLSALVGPDGAGKTTLLRLIAGLMKADGGQLRVLGLDVGAEPQAVQDRISYMPQKFGLYEDLTIQENLDLYADLHGVEPGQRKERFARLLEMTDLSRFTGRLAGQLSGGMKQKLGLACTLVRSPDLLLLDEPTVGVDPLSRRELWQIIEQLIEQERLSVLISTAYMDEAQRCAQVFVLYQGNLIAEGTPEDLSERAKDLCYGIEPAAGVPARTLQARLIDDREHIVDAVPHGGQVRFIRSGHASLEEIPSLHGEQAAQPLAARLEDGFMVLLREHASDQDQPSPQAPVDEPGGEEELESERRPIIEVRDLVRKFGDFTAVASTSFKVFKGEIFGLLGPNGAGKTTTFACSAACCQPPAATWKWPGSTLGAPGRRSAAHRLRFAEVLLYGNLSVQENPEFFGGAYGLFGGRLKARLDTVLRQFELQGQRNDRSGDLPGGYKQRLAMAVALLHEPDILFLDEPTSGIDPLARRAFWRQITELAAAGTTVVITTHFMEEAEYCDRIVIQDAGRLLALGTPEEVRRQGGEQASDMDSALHRRGRALARPTGHGGGLGGTTHAPSG